MPKLRVFRLGLRPVLNAFAISAVVLGVLALPFAVVAHSLGAFAVSAAIVGLGVLGICRSRWRADGTLDLDDAGAIVRGPGIHRRILRADIEDGFATGRDRLVLRLRGGARLEAQVDDPDQVLERLGVTLERRTITAPLRGTLGSFTRGMLTFVGAAVFGNIVLVATAHEASALWAVYLFATWATIFVVKRFRPRIVVGADGVRILGVLWPEFIPYSAIRSVEANHEGLWLETHRGPRLLPTIGQSEAEIRALTTRVEERIENFRAGGARALDALDRNSRTLAAWRDAMVSLTRGGWRDAAVDATDLETILADPKVPLERRIGAALALREREGGRAHIRVAAETAADPRVRVALEQVAGDEIDEPRLLRELERE